MTRPVLVAGAGLAGLASAITLAQRGVPVTVLEAGRLGTDRLCGEFLSPRAQRVLTELRVANLDIWHAAPQLRGLRATCSIRGGTRAECRAELPQIGRGIGREVLAGALVARARSLDVDLRERTRVLSHETTGDGVTARTSAGEETGECLILATGKLSGRSERAGAPDWVAVRCHVDGPDTGDTTELHFVPGAYVGLNRVLTRDGEATNVCALVRGATWREWGGQPRSVLESLAAASPAFAERWRRARVRGDRFQGAAGFDFRPRPEVSDDGRVHRVGDAAGLVAPLAGDGQARALGAGRELGLLIGAAGRSGRHEPAWATRSAAVGRRARWTSLMLQRALLTGRGAHLTVAAIRRFPGLLEWAFRWTRGCDELPCEPLPNAGRGPVARVREQGVGASGAGLS